MEIIPNESHLKQQIKLKNKNELWYSGHRHGGSLILYKGCYGSSIKVCNHLGVAIWDNNKDFLSALFPFITITNTCKSANITVKATQNKH